MLASPPHETASAPRAADSGAGLPDPRTASPARDDALDSARLLQGRREVTIRHGGECYRLRHTRNDKLILTK
ncbi:hemin uptake protein HemP [Luteimonas endophytica]|uniref:hemin uptake protein HemP n=1 Tax=Luteimonas endophytica TaxID=3042023 RepID=UPI002F3F5821